MKPDFEKMMKKLSESTDMMMMEYAAFFEKEVQANYVSRSGTQLTEHISVAVNLPAVHCNLS